MKKGKIASFLIALSMILLIFSGYISAEERSIFVGDLIEIKVISQEFTEDELREKFKELEIVDIESRNDGYLVTLRSFEVGEKTIQLGDKQIVIAVKSILEELERNEVFEGDLNTEEAGFYIEWKYIFFVIVSTFLITGGNNFRRYMKNRKTALLSPYQYFINQIGKITLNDHECFVKMTLCFKNYLESKFSFCIRGKTSTEIICEVSNVPELQPMLPDIQAWFTESDYYKFAGVEVSKERKQMLLEEIKEIAGKIEETKEVQV